MTCINAECAGSEYFELAINDGTLSSGGRLIDAIPDRELPEPVQRHLPPHAQDIYREAFNHSFAVHAGDPRQEEIAHRTAWSAVKTAYVKVGDSWIGRPARAH